MDISLCMIVKNEENYIDKCLSSVHDIVDEIIIVDTGSTDKTVEICSKYTDKIYDFKWINDFSAARNYSFSKANKDYIFWLDADDILLEKDREKLKHLKETIKDESINHFSMIYDYAFDNNGNVTLSLKRNRIIKNKRVPYEYWKGFVHEIIDVNIEESYKTDIHITHTRKHSNGTRNLDLFRNKLKELRNFSSRDTLYYAKELYYNNIYDEALVQFKKFLSFTDVWVEDVIDVLIKMSDIYKNQNKKELERNCLYKTFNYAMRAEALFPLALSFLEEKKYIQSNFFLESILQLKFPVNCNGFIRNDEWRLKPLIQLSCNYYYMGNIDKGRYYHEILKKEFPNNPTVKYNDKFFN